MAYFALIQFENWDEHDVAKWLKGLDDAIHEYIPQFILGNVDGRKLLMLTHSDLDKLGVTKLGHQELVLEAVDLLRSLRYLFETENLQHLALQLGCKARSLHNEILARNGENDLNKANVSAPEECPRLSISVLSGVCDIISTLKNLTSWLDRAPFETIHGISLLRNSLVKLGLELVTVAQKESGIPEVESAVVKTCQGMTEYCDELVINMKESLVVQPASLEMATIRKKPGDELGMNIQSSYFGCHIIGFIKDTSPAHLCSKIEKGDEVLQVNNQTVLGWQLAKLVAALREKPKEVTMLLKKRPRHTTPYGNYPNRRQMGSRHVPSVATLPKTTKKRRSKEGEKPQRPTLEEYVSSSVPSGDIYITKESPEDNIDGNDTDNDVFRSGSESPQSTLPVTVDAKQRRATVSGGSPTFERPSLVVEDLDPIPLRPKSQAVIISEKDAVVASMLAAEKSGQKLLVKEKAEKKLPQITQDTPNIDKLGDMLQILGNVLTADTEDKTEDVTGCQDEIDGNKYIVNISDQSVNQESQDSLTGDVVEVKGQEFIVTKPKPLNREISSRLKQQKVVSTEIAGNGGRSDLPQLMRIKRLDSEQIHQLESRMSDDEVFDKHPKPEKHVLFKEPIEVEKSKILHHVVIGGVLQTIPAESVSSTPNVKMRPKPSSKTKLNRRVSCKDLGQGECEGWLYKKKQKHGTLSKHWDKRWCVLKNSNLFYYKHKDDDAAEGVIHLPAFFVSPAPNLKTKKFAFKIHNGGTSFHFASERQDDMSKWMNKMGLAAISYTQNLHNHNNQELTLPTAKDGKPSVSSIDSKTAFYSESEGDDDDASIHGSCLSLDSTCSPQTSPATRKHPTLEEIKKSSMGTSTEELHAMLRSIEKQNLTIDGKNKIRQRQSQITASNELLMACDAATIELYRKLHSLQRTLKAKEMELQQLETFLDKPVLSSTELHTFLEMHCSENQ